MTHIYLTDQMVEILFRVSRLRKSQVSTLIVALLYIQSDKVRALPPNLMTVDLLPYDPTIMVALPPELLISAN